MKSNDVTMKKVKFSSEIETESSSTETNPNPKPNSNFNESSTNINIPSTNLSSTETNSNFNESSTNINIPSTNLSSTETNSETISPSTFHKLKNNIFYNILYNSLPFIYKYKYNPEEVNSSKSVDSIKQDSVYGFNLTNFTFANMYPKFYTKIESTDKLPDIYPDISYSTRAILDGNRNILSLNRYRAIDNAMFATVKTISNPIYHAVRNIQSYIHNGKLSLEFSNMTDIYKTNTLRENYLNQFLIQNLYQNLTQLISTATKYNLDVGNRLIPVHKIVSIPKDIQNKLFKISKYFDELKSKLILNPENGYYCYKIDDILIPIICTHEYMTYLGESPEIISMKCYVDGKCKFCDQEISAYHNQYKDELPPAIYSIILKFIDTIIEDIDKDALNLTLFDIVYEVIQKVKTNNFNDAKIIAVVSIYLYKIYVKCKDTIKFNQTKMVKFMDSMNKHCSNVGWSQNIINGLINDDKHLGSVSNIPEIIKGFMYTSSLKFTETFPVSILFRKLVNPLKEDKLVPKTVTQKLYCEGPEKMKIFNSALEKAMLKLWICDNVFESVEKIDKVNIEYQIKRIIAKGVDNGEHFFKEMCKYYCPITSNNYHKWDKEKCKECGLKMDCSNYVEVYEKYNLEINSQSTSIINTDFEDMFYIERDDYKKLVEKYDPKRLFMDYFHIDDQVTIDELSDALKVDTFYRKIAKYITRVLHIKISNEELNENRIKQYLELIVDMKMDSENKIISELKYIVSELTNCKMLMAIRTTTKSRNDEVKEVVVEDVNDS